MEQALRHLPSLVMSSLTLVGPPRSAVTCNGSRKPGPRLGVFGSLRTAEAGFRPKQCDRRVRGTVPDVGDTCQRPPLYSLSRDLRFLLNTPPPTAARCHLGLMKNLCEPFVPTPHPAFTLGPDFIRCIYNAVFSFKALPVR